MQIDPDIVDDDTDGAAVGPRRVRQRLRPRLWQDVVVVAVAAGGGLGSLARYGVAELMPVSAHGFPWSTFLVNVVGCALIGVLMVFVDDVWSARRYVRPFLGIGVLGGFTTYSTLMLDLRTLGADRELLLAGGYLLATVLGGVLAVWLGLTAARWLTRSGVRRRRAA